MQVPSEVAQLDMMLGLEGMGVVHGCNGYFVESEGWICTDEKLRGQDGHQVRGTLERNVSERRVGGTLSDLDDSLPSFNDVSTECSVKSISVHPRVKAILAKLRA